MGDTGNAVGAPHLHFEMRYPDGTPFNPYPYLIEAQQRERCAPAFGPWSNVDTSSFIQAAISVTGPHGARWLISATGQVTALGAGAYITGATDCERIDP